MGKTEEAFNFYKSVFGGEFAYLQRFKDTSESAKLPPGDQDKIMHIALPIGEDNVLMGTDTLESMGHSLTSGNNFSISISADTKKEADRIFAELSAGGKVELPLSMQFWGDYFGMFADKYGIQWMVSYAPHQKK